MSTSVRKKVKLEFIVNDGKRRISYEKRKKSLLKKVAELSILCGVEACAIVYSEFDSHPQIWPSPLEFARVVNKYRSVPEMGSTRKKLNQESYLNQRIHRAKKQLVKTRKNIREKEVNFIMFQCLGEPHVVGNLCRFDLTDINSLIDHKLEKVNSRMSALNNMAPITSQISQTQLVAAPTVADVETMHGEEAQVVHGLGFDNQMINMDGMQNEPRYMGLINNGGGIEMVPFGDVNYQNNY